MAGVAHAVRLPRLHPGVEGRVRRRQAHLRGQPIGLVQRSHRSAISPPGARRSCRTPAGRRTCRRATGCSRSRRSTRRSPASTASTRDYDRARAAGASRSPRDALRRAASSLPRAARHGRFVMTTSPHEDRAHRARSPRRFRRRSRARCETMTSLLTEGSSRAATTSRCSRPADSTTTATLHAIYPHGYWHDEHMWPWELYEMLNLAAAVERAARVRHHPLRSGVLPDVARLHAAVADADRPDAAPFAERRRSQALVALSRRRRSSRSRTSRRGCSPA